jgi:hypothetical protein
MAFLRVFYNCPMTEDGLLQLYILKKTPAVRSVAGVGILDECSWILNYSTPDSDSLARMVLKEAMATSSIFRSGSLVVKC